MPPPSVLRLLALCLFLVLACGGGLPRPTEQHLALARQTDEKVTLADLSRGRSLYGARCGSCHQLRDPARRPSEGWPHEIKAMQEQQGVKLSPSEYQDILRYLEALSGPAAR